MHLLFAVATSKPCLETWLRNEQFKAKILYALNQKLGIHGFVLHAVTQLGRHLYSDRDIVSHVLMHKGKKKFLLIVPSTQLFFIFLLLLGRMKS